MRREDADEVMASGSLSPGDAVAESVDCTPDPKTLLINDEVACIFGLAVSFVSIAGSRVVIPWALTTDTVDRYPKTFYKTSKQVVVKMFAENEVLVNYVDARYTSAVKWLRLLGFWVGEPEDLGPHGVKFRPIVRKKETFRV
jgi:hypothetical protein